MFELVVSGKTMDEIQVVIRDFSLVDDAVERWAVEWLRGRGFAVGRFSDWETPKAFCARLGISKMTFIRKTRDQRACGLFEAHWGPSRHNIVQLASSPEFDAFVKTDPRKKP